MNSAIIRTCERAGVVFGVLAVGTCLATAQPLGTTVGVAVGAALALLNLLVIRKMVARVLSAAAVASAAGAEGGASRPNMGLWAVLFVFKLGVLGAVVWAAMRFGGATPMGLLIGVSVVFSLVVVLPLLLGNGGDAAVDSTAS